MPLKSIVVTPPSPTEVAGQVQQFVATGINNNGTSDDLTQTVTWSSSDPTVATIAPGGLATAVNQGVATIRALDTASGTAGSTSLIVEAFALVSIAVGPTGLTLQAGQTQQFGAVATFSDGSQHAVTTLVTWSSSDWAVATVDAAGVVTALQGGIAAISATSGAIAGSCALTVALSALPPPPIPGSPADFLRQAQQAMFQLLLGNKPSSVDTPQLGRVEFSPTNPAQLQRVIDYLKALVEAGNTWPTDGSAGSMAAGYTRGRKPFSFYGWP